MQRGEAVRRDDRVVKLPLRIIRVGLHENGLGGPARIGILPLDLGEVLDGGLVGAVLQVGKGFIVKLGDSLAVICSGEVGRNAFAHCGGLRRRTVAPDAIHKRRCAARQRNTNQECRNDMCRLAYYRHRKPQSNDVKRMRDSRAAPSGLLS